MIVSIPSVAYLTAYDHTSSHSLRVPPGLAVKAIWPLEVRIAEKSKLIRMNMETICVLARINGHVRDICNFGPTVEWRLNFSFSQLQISQWRAPMHIKEATLARNFFSALRANENIEDFFKRVESHCVAKKANPDQRLMLL
jgi:hypothetical protein